LDAGLKVDKEKDGTNKEQEGMFMTRRGGQIREEVLTTSILPWTNEESTVQLLSM
jgi:hypothetical protein